MPFLGTITLEFCDTATQDAGKDAVLEAARRKPRDLDDWFLTLTRSNEDYMDATMNADGSFRVQCSDGLGKAEKVLVADSPVDEELLLKLLDSYYENDGAWKALCAWKAPAKKSLFQKIFD
ncbi:MAG TPA: hypothetical protein VH301_17805 [Usitatibacter sp.]|jgi:hypothetical protein|nr:hypothetical protein [Usitatibacter sp.]